MLSFTNSSNTYDGADGDARGDHDLWLYGYNLSVEGSPLGRLKKTLGGMMNLATVGDDAWISFGRALSVILHAAIAGEGLDQVPFLLNSSKDNALARILEEGVSILPQALFALGEEARDLTMTEWIRHCAELLGSKSLSDRSKAALTLEVNGFFHHETWTPYFPPGGTGPGGLICQAQASYARLLRQRCCRWFGRGNSRSRTLSAWLP